MTRWLVLGLSLLVLGRVYWMTGQEPDALRWNRLAHATGIEIREAHPDSSRLCLRGSYPDVLTFLEAIETAGERIAGVEMVVGSDEVPEWVIQLAR